MGRRVARGGQELAADVTKILALLRVALVRILALRDQQPRRARSLDSVFQVSSLNLVQLQPRVRACERLA